MSSKVDCENVPKSLKQVTETAGRYWEVDNEL